MGTEIYQVKKKQKDEYTTRTYRYLVPDTWYLILHFIRGTAVCSKESTAQHDTAPQRRTRHGTALRCAAELYVAGVELS